MNTESKNLVSTEEIINATKLLKDGKKALINADAIDYENNCKVYLILKKETNKIKYLANAEAVCSDSGVSIGNWMTKRATFNVALKNGLKLQNFTSQKQLLDANKDLKVGTKKVQKNGKLVQDVKNSAKIQAEKVEIQAVNENEIISLMAMSEFKTAVKFLDDNGILKSTFMKAWAKVQASNHE